jgi:hypothetical protein
MAIFTDSSANFLMDIFLFILLFAVPPFFKLVFQKILVIEKKDRGRTGERGERHNV